MSRSEAKTLVENNGGKVLGSISKKLNILVIGESKPTKKKIENAKLLDIKIIKENEWYKILNLWTSHFKVKKFWFVHKFVKIIKNIFMVVI